MAAPSYSFSWPSEARSVTAASGSSMSILGGFLDDAGGDCGPQTTLGDLIASSGPDLRGLCSRAIAIRVVSWALWVKGGVGWVGVKSCDFDQLFKRAAHKTANFVDVM